MPSKSMNLAWNVFVGRMKVLIRAVAFAFLFLGVFPQMSALAVPLLTVSGTTDFAAHAISPDGAVAIPFVVNSSIANVSITADLTCAASSPDPNATCQGVAYLTTDIGTNFDVSTDLVDAVGFSAINFLGAGNDTTLFTGLTLNAGSYFLLVAHDQSAPPFDLVVWNGSTSPDVFNDASVSGGGAFTNFFETSTDPVAPSTIFNSITSNAAFFSIVQEDDNGGGNPTPVPEPSTMILLLTGLLGGYLAKRRGQVT